jgi:site-specific DNA recombinase
MMKVALYGRFSTEGQRETSIEDQNRNCERRAAQEGWTITARYHDKGISGSHDEKGRPGYKEMLAAAKAKQFDALLVDDLSRLTRDEGELIKTRKLFVFWGIRLIGVSDGFDTAQKGHKIQASFHGIKNEMFLDELRDKTKRGLEGQALKGYSCGGRSYGYRPVRITNPNKTDRYGEPELIGVKREIDENQAQWVRQIFQWYADGWSPRKIVNELNSLKVPAPGAFYRRKRQGRGGAWSATALHGELRSATGILSNPIYIGQLIWNRRSWERNPETNKKVPRLRPENEWVMTANAVPQIIDKTLWDRVQARRQAQANGKFVGARARLGRGPKYTLSGLLKCGECGSNFVMQSSYQYGCAGHKDSGAAHCANHLKVSRLVAEKRLLMGIKAHLFTPEGLALYIKETTRLLMEHARQHQPERERAERRLVEIEREISNIMVAIKQGILTSSTKHELEKLEAEQTRLQQAITSTTNKVDKVVTLLPRAQERYREIIERLGSVRSADEAREQIRTLLGEIKLIATADGYLEAELVGRYEGLVKLAVGAKLNNVVAGEGFEPSTFGL